jgi:S-formylglutathione hydrolase FrmB
MAAVYWLTMALVLAHETGRLSDWLDDFGRAGETRLHLSALNFSADLRAFASARGLDALSRLEGRLLEALTPTTVVGTIRPPATPRAAAPRPAGQTTPNLTDPGPAASPADASAAAGPAVAPSTAPVGAEAQAAASASSTSETPEAPNGPAEAPAQEEGAQDGAQATDVQIIPLQAGSAPPPAFGNVLLLGDSLMLEGLGPALERRLKSFENLTVSREGQYSTGLSRPDVLDWTAFLAEQLDAKRPDLVIITLGANDTQDIVVDRKRHLVASESWNEIYGQRVGQLLATAQERGAMVCWVGLPIMGREPYNARAANINSVAAQACAQAPNCRFWDATSSLTDEAGRFTTFKTLADGSHVRVRAKDSIHLTEQGGRLMAEDLLDDAASWAQWGPKSQAGSAEGLAPAAGQTETPHDGQQAPTEARPEGQPEAAAQPDGPSTPETAAGSQSLSPAQPGEPSADPVEPDQTKTTFAPEPPPFELTTTILISKLRDQATTYLAVAPALASTAADADAAGPTAGPTAGSPAGPTTGTPPETTAGSPAGTIAGTGPRGNGAGENASAENASELALYPAVILLHGAEADHRFFRDGVGADELVEWARQRRLVLIMPDGAPFGWYLDSPLKPENRIKSYLLDELLPDVLSKLPVDPQRLGLVGISMGGHGALTLALTNPGRFKAVGSLSGVLDLENHGGDSTLDRWLQIADLLGPYKDSPELWRENSAYFLTRRAPEALKGTAVKTTVGLSDKLCLADNRQYDRLLTELGLAHDYLEETGGHDWRLWRAQLPAHLDFMAEHL